MEIDATTFKAETDGAFSVLVDKKPTRLVKESDLLAVKESSGSKAKEWDTERATFTSKLEESSKAQETIRQSLLQEQAAKEAVVAKYADYDTWKTKVGELDKTLLEHKTSLQKHQEELTSRIKSGLMSAGVKEESLKDKNLDQLRNLEEAARLFAGNQQKKPANYEGGTGGGGSAPESNFERAKRIIAAQEEKQGKIKVASK